MLRPYEYEIQMASDRLVALMGLIFEIADSFVNRSHIIPINPISF